MLRFGIAGIGTIAKDYIEIIAAGQVKDIKLTALCSRNQRTVQAVKEQYHLDAAAFQDYEAMLRSGVIDTVLICTPHGLHPAMTLQAIDSGTHVLVEKPVGIFGDEVEAAIHALEQHPGLMCGVLYNRRASQAFRYVKGLMEQGEIGALVRCTWIITNLYRTKAYYESGSWRGTWQGEGGGLLMTQASHQLDLMQWLCGMPSAVSARCSSVDRPIEVENEAELFLSYPNGAHGHFIASAHECPGTNLLEICGTKGKITVRDDRLVEVVALTQDEREFTRSCPDPFKKAPFSVQTVTFDDSDNKIQQAATIQNFVQAVGGRAEIQCSLAEGYKSLQIIHGAYLSHWEGREKTLPVGEKEFRNHLDNMANA